MIRANFCADAPVQGSFRESMLSFDMQVDQWRRERGRPGYATKLRQSLERLSSGRSFDRIRGSGRWLARKLSRRGNAAVAPAETNATEQPQIEEQIRDEVHGQCRCCCASEQKRRGGGSFGGSRSSFLSRVSFDRSQMGARRKVGFSPTVEQRTYSVGDDAKSIPHKREQWKAAAAERVSLNAARRTTPLQEAGRRGSVGADATNSQSARRYSAGGTPLSARRNSTGRKGKIVLDPNGRPIVPPPPPGASCDVDGNPIVYPSKNPRRQLWAGNGRLSTGSPAPPPPARRRSLRDGQGMVGMTPGMTPGSIKDPSMEGRNSSASEQEERFKRRSLREIGQNPNITP
eukprot:SAG31_NODE_7437_length_1689_cov_1.357233_1_plen_345_part_00